MSHTFLSPLKQVYQECPHCGKRKSIICIKCKFCYTCHPVSEHIERKPKKSYFAIGNLPDIESIVA